MSKKIRKLFRRFSSVSETSLEDDLRSLNEYEIYCSPCSSSYLTASSQSSECTDGGGDSASIPRSPALQRGRHQLVIRRSEKEVLTQEIFIHQPPSLIKEPLQDRTLAGLDSAWRIALDRVGEKIYVTNNQLEGGEYSIFTLTEGNRLLKTVKCRDIVKIRGIALDDSDNVYVSGNHMVQKYDSEGELLATYGGHEAGPAPHQLDDPNGVCCRGGRVYVCDSRNHRVLVLSQEALELVEVVGDAHTLAHPEDLVFDKKGHMHVLDSGKLSVVVFDADGTCLREITLPDDIVLFPVSLRMIANNYYISDLSRSLIAVFSCSGRPLHQVPVRSLEAVVEDTDGFVHVGVTQRPVGLAVDFDGYIYVSNIDSKEILVF